jgi:hypothetical protein
MHSPDEVDAMLVASHYPSVGRKREAVDLAARLAASEGLLGVLTTSGVQVDGRFYGDHHGQEEWPVLLTTDRLLFIRFGKEASVAISDIASVAQIEDGRRFTVTTDDGHTWTIGCRQSWFSRYGHKEEAVQFRHLLEARLRASQL